MMITESASDKRTNFDPSDGWMFCCVGTEEFRTKLGASEFDIDDQIMTQYIHVFLFFTKGV